MNTDHMQRANNIVDRVLRALFRRLLLSAAMVVPCGVYGQMPVAGYDDRQIDSLLQDAVTIEEIVVTAPRTLEIVPAQRLEGAVLQKLGNHNVADAIRYFSGAQIKDYGGVGGLKTVNIRSMGSEHVGVFFDGMQIGNAQNSVVDLGRFSLDNMESVSLYNGQKSAIFQSAKDFASASAIYMETRRPVFDSTRTDNLKFTLKGGSFKTVNPSVLWEHKFGDRVRMSANADYLYSSGEYKYRYTNLDGYDTVAVRSNSDVKYFRGEATVFGDLDDGEWRGKAYYYSSERGYPGAVVREQPGKLFCEGRQWDTDFFVQGSLMRRPVPFYSFSLKGKYAYNYMHYLEDSDNNKYINNHYRQHEAYVSSANMFSIFPWWSADLSVDFQWNRLDADLVDFVYPSRYTLLAAAATSMQFSRVSVQASLLYTHVTDVTRRRGQQAGAKNRFSPTVIVSYKPFRRHDLSIRAFYKNIFRMPTFNDLYYTEIGNASLKPEDAVQYDAGVTYAREWHRGWGTVHFDAQADFYFNQVKNKIIAYPGVSQFRWTMINLGYVEIRGVDIALGGMLRRGDFAVDVRLNYTYQDAQDLTDPDEEYYGNMIPYIPDHSGSAIVGLAWRDWSLNYSFIYTGIRYVTRANTLQDYVPAWYTHDVTLSRRIELQRSALLVSLEVNNILNQQYEVVNCYPMPGTNFRLIVSVTL